jgi:hypothetical protein
MPDTVISQNSSNEGYQLQYLSSLISHLYCEGASIGTLAILMCYMIYVSFGRTDIRDFITNVDTKWSTWI